MSIDPAAARAPVWVFDVDGTLLDGMSARSLRPGAMDLMDELTARGIRIVVWSAGGADYARRRLAAAGIAEFVSAWHDKDARDADLRYVTTHLDIDLDHTVFVDDQPKDLPIGARVIAVRPYLAPNDYDQGLSAILHMLRADE